MGGVEYIASIQKQNIKNILCQSKHHLSLFLSWISGNVKQGENTRTAQSEDEQGSVEYENNTAKGQKRKGGIQKFSNPQKWP